jgi:hypothetical protein
MATVNGLTAARMAVIEGQSVVDGSIIGTHLILERFNASTIDAGVVVGPPGPTGPPGTEVPAGGAQGQILEKVSSTDYDFVWSTLLRAIVFNNRTASYTLVLGDQEDMVLCDSASALVVTVPPNSVTAFPLGTRIRVANINTGAVSIAGDTGVTLRYPVEQTPTLAGRGASVELIKINTDEWILDGHGNLTTIAVPWTTYTPNIVATTSGPTFGGNDQRTGFYAIDSQKRVLGGASIRFGSTGSPGRGSGTYRCTLPVAGVNYDPQGYSSIGTASGGSGVTHTSGQFHFNGITPSTSSGLVAFNGGLFLTGAAPAGSAIDMNVHYSFLYQAA